MNKDSNIVRTTLYLSPELHAAVRRVAQAHKRSFNSEVIWALEQYLAQEERRKPTKPIV